MRGGQERVPFFPRHGVNAAPAVHPFAGAVSAVDKHTGIAWIVQDAQHVAVLEGAPDHLAFSGTGMQTARKQEAAVAELSYRSQGRACSLECLEQQPDGSLNLLVGIQDQPPQRFVGETNGRL